MYLSTTDETYLYKPLWGTGPAVAALSVAAHQVLGDSPILPTHAPGLTFSLLPLTSVAIAAVSQYGVYSSRDFIATCVSLVVAWIYLRWLHTYAPGVVGDTRDEFDFLTMVPNPFRQEDLSLRMCCFPFPRHAFMYASLCRVALRPLVKLVGAVLLRLPFFVGASGDGMKTLSSLAMSSSVGGGNVYGVGSDSRLSGTVATPDPVAERRRERALKALDKKLAELRSSIRTPLTSSASGPLLAASASTSSTGGSITTADEVPGASLSEGSLAGSSRVIVGDHDGPASSGTV